MAEANQITETNTPRSPVSEQWRSTLKGQQQQWLQRFHKLSRRDQQALMLLSGFLLFLFIVYGLAVPAVDYHKQARQSYTQEQQLLDWMKAQEPAVMALQEQPATTTADSSPETSNPITLVNKSAKDYNLTIKRLQPESNGSLRVWMEQVSFNNTILWLNHVQKSGLQVEDISLDQQAAGIINVRATFNTPL